ncbi:MAG: GDP-mannose 4,6-dehydratase [Firmicutes bacterium]|nr:GDP-mannose 4,6-dehydratase [Bacillota bacterium]
MKHALVTGGAGFIGSHLVDRLLAEGWRVTVVDNFDPFYDPALKEKNIEFHLRDPNYTLVRADIRDLDNMKSRLSGDYDVIVHLAAKAGVRPSIKNPATYQEVNVRGTQNMLELAKEWGIKQFLFASSSSVYGVNPRVPWREDDYVLMPISPYAATKVAGELLGHVYSHLYGIRFIALRLFTVYGPRQRPDLAIHKFAKLIINDEPIPVYGDGTSLRDYTYIADIVDGIIAAINYDKTMYEVINLGNSHAVTLCELVQCLEEVLGLRAKIERLPAQPGDVPRTYADINKARKLLSFNPKVELPVGVRYFVLSF